MRAYIILCASHSNRCAKTLCFLKNLPPSVWRRRGDANHKEETCGPAALLVVMVGVASIDTANTWQTCGLNIYLFLVYTKTVDYR